MDSELVGNSALAPVPPFPIGVTALGFGLAGAAWGWLVLVAFVVTLLAGLAVALGVHWFVAGLLAKRAGKAPSRAASRPT